MRCLALLTWGCLLISGCAAPTFTTTVYPNPMPAPPLDRDFLWDQVVDVVDDEFRIAREDRVRLAGDVLTEGRIETAPTIGSTIFEPWRGDSADQYEKLESTLQSIRRSATVRVIPADGGYLIDVAVFKELEDVPRPEFATVGEATFRHDASLDGYQEPVGPRLVERGWIPLGRDAALEQRMLNQIAARLGAAPQPSAAPYGISY